MLVSAFMPTRRFAPLPWLTRDINTDEYEKISSEEPPLEQLTLIGVVGHGPSSAWVVESVAAFRLAGVCCVA